MPGQRRFLLNRNHNLRRNDLERAIFIPFRTRNSASALNIPTSASTSSISSTANNGGSGARELRNLFENASNANSGDNADNNVRRTGGETHSTGANNSQQQPRINVSTFFMELTYSAADTHHNYFPGLKGSTIEAQRRKMEVHSLNTMTLIKRYCPDKLHKFSQFRYCSRALKHDFFSFKNFQNGNPLAMLDPTQDRCNTQIMVVVRESNFVPGKWGNPFTAYLMNYLFKRRLNPTCLTFQTDSALNVLIEQLYTDLHVFSKKANLQDPAFKKQVRGFLILSIIAKLIENWKIPILVLDSCLWKSLDVESVLEFGKAFQLKVFDVDSSEGVGGTCTNRHRKQHAKRVAKEIKKILTEYNMERVRKEMEKLEMGNPPSNRSTKSNSINTNLINDDCRRIVYNLHERMSNSVMEPERNINGIISERTEEVPLSSSRDSPQLTLLEDGILADIESSDAFRYSARHSTSHTPRSEENYTRNSSNTCESSQAIGYSEEGSEEDEEMSLIHGENVSELLFNELNQRWRVQGPQRFIPRGGGGGADAGPYCNPILDSERQLILSVLQEVTSFEMLKDIRNALKDSKKDLEGRLHGYNPDFSNLIASAEEFLHGKSSCMEPSQDEMDFYKMPVSLVYSDADVKFLKTKPPVYAIGSETPNRFIKMAMEESTRLFMDAVMHTTCGSRYIPTSKRNKTKAVVIVEDNNEALELLAVALWFFDKTPVATFQTKYVSNSNDFHLCLDAIRFYYGNYPVYCTKKEDEHIFERYIGVGLNGLLRTFQNKIILIDFPHPGMRLQKSMDILYNQLRLEANLHGIQSVYVYKPCRKEDNLSTVEKALNDIQQCLEPRDKLFFRKARRMYLDLKLYKQIEQKSRQDVKALRDWGLPEPENEHFLWERLRNSEIVWNLPTPRTTPPSPKPDL